MEVLRLARGGVPGVDPAGQRASVFAHVALGVALTGPEGEQLLHLAGVVLVWGLLGAARPESQISIAGSIVIALSIRGKLARHSERWVGSA